MTKDELNTIFSLPNASIIAPAGHGKTEMLVDMVNFSSKKVLLLTHTNAGVSAITKRLKAKDIPSSKYEINTIASFCNKWCFAYKKTSQIPEDMNLLNVESAKDYYNYIYNGTKLIFKNKWALNVLQETYSRVIVDEYQDCNVAQHSVFLEINKKIPVIVLGDPLQGIFDFEPIVDFNEIAFKNVPIETKPWRWINAKTTKLGDYLSKIREQINKIIVRDSGYIDIEQNEYVKIISKDQLHDHDFFSEINDNNSIVYISKWEPDQILFSKTTNGFFQNDEKIMCDELFEYADCFDNAKNFDLILHIIHYANLCMTNVNKELGGYIKKITNHDMDFTDIKEYTGFAKIIDNANYKNDKCMILDLLNWFAKEKTFKKYRFELLYEMIRSVQYAIDNNISIYDAALSIRTKMNLHKDYNCFKRLSSRTLLCKGLEFDCAIIDVISYKNELSPKEFYVAMTRATKKIYIVANSNRIYLKKQKTKCQ